MVELPFMFVQVLNSLLLLLLANNAREALATAVRMRRGGANAWAAAVGRVGRMSSRRRRGADISSSDLWVARRHGVDGRFGVCTRDCRSARARGSA